MAKKRAMLLVRYPVNTISSILIVLVFFTMIFFGGRALDQQALSDSLGGIIVGFFLWTLATTAFSSLAWNVTHESQWGTLEQLFMSPYGFGRVMAIHVVVRVLESFMWGAVTLVFMLALTGQFLYVDPLTVLPVVVLTLAQAVGFGFAFAGVALLYKRVENVFNLVQFVFIGLISASATGIDWLSALPLVHGSGMLTVAMRDGVRLWQFDPAVLAVLVVTGLGYLLAGYAIFHRAQRRAREKGLMGHY